MKPSLEFGLTQVYTGKGKGKTSAAFGLALRSLGRGLRVYVIQFIKGGFDYGEFHVVKKFTNLKLTAYGRGQFIQTDTVSEEDRKLAREALEHARRIVLSGDYDVVILDEINVALSLGLLRLEDVIFLIKDKPKNIELVLTGRNAPNEIIEIADLVTEMKEIKHPFNKGMKGRRGIEF